MPNRYRIPDWLFSLAAILAAIAIALYFRVVLPYPAIFDGQWIKFSGVDSYYYMRLADNLVANFPILTGFDPYSIFPGGRAVPVQGTFFAYMLCGIIKLLGASGSQQSMDTIAAYIPATMGALLVVPVFFAGRALAGRWSGLVAALVVAVMPGQLLSRTLLGAVDHHAAELFLTSFFMLFFILALQHSRSFSYGQVRRGEFPPAGKHIPYSFIAGIFLGLYLITWQGALMLVLILFVFFIFQFTSDHLRGLPTDYLSKTAITCFLIALLIFLPVSRDKMTLLALAAVILMPIALNIASIVMTSYKMKPAYFVAAVATLLAAGGLAAWLLFPTIYASGTGYLYEFFSWRSEQNVVVEMKSLFLPGGFFTLNMAWSEFALALYSGVAGLALLVYHCIRRGEPGHIFTAVWSLVWMFISFAMVRFTAYFALSLAILTGYAAGCLIQAFATGREARAETRPGKKARRAAPPARKFTSRQVAAVALVIALTAAVVIPCMVNSAALAKGNLGTPSNAWMEAMDWMSKNTPEPLGDAGCYYKLYPAPAEGRGFEYPATAYGVAVWSDYGYWVTRIGHRIPLSNPGTWNWRGEQVYFTAQDNATAARMMADWGAKYVIVDDRIASPIKFFAAASLSGMNEADFYERCWQKKGDKYEPVVVIYPDYYRSMVSRLYSFDGKQVTPTSTLVMEYQEVVTQGGQKVKEITSVKNFNSYSEAEAYITSQKQGNHRIIGTDPISSPVPLEALQNYRLVYQSTQKGKTGSTPLPAVKIFEYNQ